MMKNKLEEFIHNNREGFDNKTPNPEVLDRILQQMQAKEKEKPKGILISFRAVYWAAAAMVIIACGGVFFITQKPAVNVATVKPKTGTPRQMENPVADSIQQVPASEIAKDKPVERKSLDSVDNDLSVRKNAFIARLKVQNEKKQVVFASLNNMESSASRINAVSGAATLKNTGNDVVDALVTTLNTDPSANVRLAALDGLARFYREEYVRKKLVASLKKQQDPLVQIALIELLTRMKESGILTELDKLVNDDKTLQAVKDCAYSGIYRLRSS
ncbi:MAG TPA: HEAT repeat domain-containing protein [Mucilaginibacter sp.]|jgi:hypothetical protein